MFDPDTLALVVQGAPAHLDDELQDIIQEDTGDYITTKMRLEKLATELSRGLTEGLNRDLPPPLEFNITLPYGRSTLRVVRVQMQPDEHGELQIRTLNRQLLGPGSEAKPHELVLSTGAVDGQPAAPPTSSGTAVAPASGPTSGGPAPAAPGAELSPLDKARQDGRAWFKRKVDVSKLQGSAWNAWSFRATSKIREAKSDRDRAFWEGVRQVLDEVLEARGLGPAAPLPEVLPAPPPAPASERAEETALQKAADQVPDRAARVKKLRVLAAANRKRADELRNSGTHNQNVTARRSRIIAGQEQQADRLEEVAGKLEALAAGLEEGCEPPALAGVDLVGCLPAVLGKIDSRAVVEDLLRHKELPRATLTQGHVRTLLDLTKGQRGAADDRRRVERELSACDPWCRLDHVGLIAAVERLQKIAAHTGKDKYAVGDIKDRIAPYKRMLAAGIDTEARYQEARAALLALGKPRPTVPPKERRIRDLERELLSTQKGIPGYFPTPREVVQRLIIEADLDRGQRVLEPSAGKGDIAVALRQAGATPEVIEPVTRLRELLELKGFPLVASDFLTYDPGPIYDRILMNPPFEDSQDITHVQHAYELLKPGGRVVAVMSEGPFFREDKKSAAFREWLDRVGGWSNKLPAGAFMASDRPTGVATRIVVINKRGQGEVRA